MPTRRTVLLVSVAVASAIFACGDDATERPDDSGKETVTPQRSEFGLDRRPLNPTCKAPARPPPAVDVTFQRVYSGVTLGTSMMLAQPPGDSTRWFVARRDGAIVSFPVLNPPATPAQVANLATLAGKPVQQNGEGGLLGFAFHPRFSENGKLYVSWVTTGGTSNYRSEVGVLTTADKGASFTSYETILGPFNQPASNHNGGGIAFGTDGYLYLSFGDGGGGGDTYVNGQKTTGFFSKILRIDVDNPAGGLKYGIPDGNPFKAGGGEPATFAWGFRNPFRFSVDRATGEVWAGDVGQDDWEEIDRVQLGGNYGWPCREGTHDYASDDTARCPNPDAAFVEPIVEHQHIPQNSRSITGGVVYRGTSIPGFAGTYVYGDFEKQELWALAFDTTTGAPKTTQLNAQGGPSSNWVSFAEDVAGEIYAVSLTGEMWKLVAASTGGTSTFPDLLSKTGCTDPADVKKPAEGLVPYGVNAQLWSDGAEKHRFLALLDGASITVGADGDFDLPVGSVLVKTFLLGGRRIETRLLVRHDDGGWAGYTYEWLDDESDAVLLPASKSKTVGAQTWYFPSRSDCARCHTEAAKRTLGLEIGQLNGDFVYTSTNRVANQLKTLEHIGMFSAPLGKPVSELAVIPDPFGPAQLEARARAYLHGNCSQCHRPGGGGRSNLDARFFTPLEEMNACNAAPEAGELGIPGARLVAPGSPATSLISVRTHALGSNRMPPLASSLVDERGVSVIDDWIRSLTTCP